MVRTVDSLIGWRAASAARTASAVQSGVRQTASMTRCSSWLRGFRALNIVALQNVAQNGARVKTGGLADWRICRKRYIFGWIRAPYTGGRLKWFIAGWPLPNILWV